ncbi:molybdopterin-dependent oxidoreductase [Bacillus licheniformis]|nr:molybdopterin-dependent oxidoreductase [Bacillus licheniformis]
MFLSETAILADVVLPASSYLEDEGTMTNLEGRVTLREASKPCPGEARHDWQIFVDIAKALGKAAIFISIGRGCFNELRKRAAAELPTIRASPMNV